MCATFRRIPRRNSFPPNKKYQIYFLFNLVNWINFSPIFKNLKFAFGCECVSVRVNRVKLTFRLRIDNFQEKEKQNTKSILMDFISSLVGKIGEQNFSWLSLFYKWNNWRTLFRTYYVRWNWLSFNVKINVRNEMILNRGR